MRKIMKNTSITIIFIMFFIIFAYFYQTKSKFGFILKKSMYFDVKIEKSLSKEERLKIINILTERLNAVGIKDSKIRKVSEETFTVVIKEKDIKKVMELLDKNLPKNSNKSILERLVSPTFLEFQLINDDGSLKNTGLTRKDIIKCELLEENQFNVMSISLEFNSEGTKKLADITKKNIGKQLSITLDGIVQTAPTIQSELTDGKAQITGSYTKEEASVLVKFLNMQELPTKLLVKGEIEKINPINSIIILLTYLILFIYLIIQLRNNKKGEKV